MSTYKFARPEVDVEGGCRGCPPHPPFLIIAVQSLYSYTKSAVLLGMYYQQFTLCYCLVKSLLLCIRF